jgi:hypothetical protein
LHRLFKAPPDPQLTLPLYQQLRICSDRVFFMPAISWTSLFLLCARQQVVEDYRWALWRDTLPWTQAPRMDEDKVIFVTTVAGSTRS